MVRSQRKTMRGTLLQMRKWYRRQIIDDTPDDIAFCECDCREQQCLQGDWEECEKRLQSVANCPSDSKAAN
jgi:hypothetical protein